MPFRFVDRPDSYHITLFTLGYQMGPTPSPQDLSIEAFLWRLQTYKIGRVIDLRPVDRTIAELDEADLPSSPYHPTHLQQHLAVKNIDYFNHLNGGVEIAFFQSVLENPRRWRERAIEVGNVLAQFLSHCMSVPEGGRVAFVGKPLAPETCPRHTVMSRFWVQDPLNLLSAELKLEVRHILPFGDPSEPLTKTSFPPAKVNLEVLF
jgi:hypothetical protein